MHHEGMKGRVRAWRVAEHQDFYKWALKPCTNWVSNLVLRQWAAIAGKLFTEGAREYRISGMYIEYVNVASPGDPGSIPSYDRNPASGVAYYDSLVDSADRDYLRVPMTAATMESSDADLYPDGNLLTFFAQTFGTAGVHGKPFSSDNNSVVVGGALVAMVSDVDPTRDLVLSRFYYAVDEQQPKLATGQIGLEWELTLE